MDRICVYTTGHGTWVLRVFSAISGYWCREFDDAARLLRYLGV